MRCVKEAIVVEGKYDAQRVRAAVNGTVVETGGFRVFKDPEKVALLRQLAADRGSLSSRIATAPVWSSVTTCWDVSPASR